MSETDIALLPAEELRMCKEEILADAKALAENIVKGLPKGATPAQERNLLHNSEDIYRMTADIIFTMLKAKRGVLH